MVYVYPVNGKNIDTMKWIRCLIDCCCCRLKLISFSATWICRWGVVSTFTFRIRNLINWLYLLSTSAIFLGLLQFDYSKIFVPSVMWLACIYLVVAVGFDLIGCSCDRTWGNAILVPAILLVGTWYILICPTVIVYNLCIEAAVAFFNEWQPVERGIFFCFKCDAVLVLCIWFVAYYNLIWTSLNGLNCYFGFTHKIGW